MTRPDTVVERAIKHCGSQIELARQLSKLLGYEISRQRVFEWKKRGVFPREVIPAVAKLTPIPLMELVLAKRIARDKGCPVDRSIRSLGADANAATLAAALSSIPGCRKITRQHVNGWQDTGQIPLDMVPHVHLLTKIPVRDLIATRART